LTLTLASRAPRCRVAVCGAPQRCSSFVPSPCAAARRAPLRRAPLRRAPLRCAPLRRAPLRRTADVGGGLPPSIPLPLLSLPLHRPLSLPLPLRGWELVDSHSNCRGNLGCKRLDHGLVAGPAATRKSASDLEREAHRLQPGDLRNILQRRGKVAASRAPCGKRQAASVSWGGERCVCEARVCGREYV
jgi:hypothetical protein